MPALARTPDRLLQTRAFTTTRINRLADVVDESFDPKSVDRESDEVDVCIVGGGRSKNKLACFCATTSHLLTVLVC